MFIYESLLQTFKLYIYFCTNKKTTLGLSHDFEQSHFHETAVIGQYALYSGHKPFH